MFGLLHCSIRTSFSVVRTIANRLREEKGRFVEAPLELDMRLPLLQNITSTSKACPVADHPVTHDLCKWETS